jgi:hypothetical protein
MNILLRKKQGSYMPLVLKSGKEGLYLGGRGRTLPVPYALSSMYV